MVGYKQAFKVDLGVIKSLLLREVGNWTHGEVKNKTNPKKW